MVTFAPGNFKKSFGQSFGETISQTLPPLIEKFNNARQQTREAEQLAKITDAENKAVKQTYGVDISAFTDLGTRRNLIQTADKDQRRNQRLAAFGLSPDMSGNEPSKAQPQVNQDIASKYESWSPEQQALFAANFPTEANAIQKQVESRQRENLAKRKQEFTENQANLNREQTEKNRQTQERRDIHKESAKYDEELISNAKVAKKQIETLDDIEKAINSGNVKPGSWTNIFKGFGKIGEQVSKAITNKDEATLQASIPALLEGWKDVFGVRLSDADLKVLQDKLPDIGKNPAANKAILKIMRKYADQTLLRSKIASQIKKENKGWRPLGYADTIEERYDQMIAPIKVKNPHTGRTVEIPAYQVSAAVEDGGEIINE